jgi:hypothetical protein
VKALRFSGPFNLIARAASTCSTISPSYFIVISGYVARVHNLSGIVRTFKLARASWSKFSNPYVATTTRIQNYTQFTECCTEAIEVEHDINLKACIVRT